MTKAIMIAAVKSGSGKTTFTCGLMQALLERGLKVKSFKCGPDYIDPMFHRTVLGVPSGNLDSFFCEKDKLRKIAGDGAKGADIAIIEGVMGIYDGAGVSRTGSSYDLAEKLGIPILLLVDAKGMGATVISLIKGILADDESHLIKAVVLNQMSAHYYGMVAPVIEKETGIRVLGYLPRMTDIGFESRHLGLKLPLEIADIQGKIGRVARQIEETVNVDGLLECGGRLPDTEDDIKHNYDIRIAVARDEAFCFYYEENLRLLQRLGAELVYFSPIHDSVIPDNVDGLYIGGGYPELYARALGDNLPMRESVKNAIQSGIPSIAECGGFQYLQESLESEPMAGAIHGESFDTGKLVRFGYVTLTAKTDTFLEKGDSIKAHEFHYYDSTDNGNDIMCVKASNGAIYEAVFAGDNYWWGYPHIYMPSNESFAERFILACRAAGKVN